MNLKLVVWRQASSDVSGKFEEYDISNIDGDMSFLEMIDVLNENIILAGGVTGGMFRSTDGGQSWNLTTSPGQLHNVTCVAQDTRDGKEDTWYFGSGENRGGWLGDVSFLGNGIYKSTDGGLSLIHI